MTKKYYVYIIQSKEGYNFTGITENLNQPLTNNVNKSTSFWTKRGTKWELIYSEEFLDINQAKEKEEWLKSGIGKEYIYKNLLL
jgi:putative endonuclease